MSDKKLRRALIKLAHDKPELRGDILPLLREKRAGRTTSYDRMLFRLPFDDPKAEKLALLLQKAGHRTVPSKDVPGRQFVTDMVFQLSRSDIKKFPGLWNYRLPVGWEGFGPGALEGMEYKVISKGKGRMGRPKQIKMRGEYVVYGEYGETTVSIPEMTVNVDSLDPDDIRETIDDEIQWFLDDNPELYLPQFEDEDEDALYY